MNVLVPVLLLAVAIVGGYAIYGAEFSVGGLIGLIVGVVGLLLIARAWQVLARRGRRR